MVSRTSSFPNSAVGQAHICGLACGVSMLLGALLTSSCQRAEKVLQQESWPTNAIARVGDHFITSDDLKAEIEYRVENRRTVPAPEALVNELAIFEAVLQAARKAGVDQQREIRRGVGNLIIGHWKEERLKTASEQNVTPDELEQAYAVNRARYTQAATVRLSLLRLELQKHDSVAKVEEAMARMREARDSMPVPPVGNDEKASLARAQGFGKISVRYSDETTSRYRGGDIGWLKAGVFEYRWPREVLLAGYALKPGDMSDVIRSESGVYLVMKTDERPEKVTPLAEVQATLRQSILAERRRAADTRLIEQAVLASKTVIETNRLGVISQDLYALIAEKRKTEAASAEVPATPRLQ